MEKIKLENLVVKGYDRNTGQLVIQETSEYICSVCHHLVDIADNFCWFCGNKLEVSDLVEHWCNNRKLSNEQFRTAKSKKGKDLLDFISSIPEYIVEEKIK